MSGRPSPTRKRVSRIGPLGDLVFRQRELYTRPPCLLMRELLGLEYSACCAVPCRSVSAELKDHDPPLKPNSIVQCKKGMRGIEDAALRAARKQHTSTDYPILPSEMYNRGGTVKISALKLVPSHLEPLPTCSGSGTLHRSHSNV